ncbi:MAG: 2-C-methyl-D-erythritol 2,4-cyclodiphosphate synthase, partial [Okeania sp. SIO2G5]|nr:2-C-methyl-D-erythritol 2,4-cyclodiphosphate synthase [Okeania sp. SIO2G5]
LLDHPGRGRHRGRRLHRRQRRLSRHVRHRQGRGRGVPRAALSLGDIGHYFPPSDPKWKGADSLVLLEQVNQLILAKGWAVGNIDSVLVAEKPKLKPHISQMRDRLASVLNLDPTQVGVKATTNEKLGPTGREEGIASYAVTLLVKA